MTAPTSSPLAAPETLFDKTPDPAPESAAPPDFAKMKVAELDAFYESKGAYISIEGFDKLSVKEKRVRLKALFPDPDSVEDPETTGFDPNDLLHQTVAEIQKLSTEAEAVAYLEAAQDAANFNFFKVGGSLAEMQANGWTGEYDDFYQFAENTFGIRVRKAQVLIQVYHALVSCGATWKEAQPVGWSKLAVLAPILTSENYGEWFAKCGPDITFVTVGQLMKDFTAAGGEKGDPVGDLQSTPLKKRTYTFHEDQLEAIDEAIAKAKQVSGTDYDGQAIERICLDYLAGGKLPVVLEASDDLPAPTAALAVEVGTLDFTDFKPSAEQLQQMFESLSEVDDDAYIAVLNAFDAVFEGVDLDVYPNGRPADGE